MGLPIWHYQVGGTVIEKQILLPHGQNTVHIRYRILEGDAHLRLKLRPSFHFRPQEAAVDAQPAESCTVAVNHDRYETYSRTHFIAPLRMYLHSEKPAFTLESKHFPNILYRVEESRGYAAKAGCGSPGYFRGDLTPGHSITLTASTESWEDHSVAQTGGSAGGRVRAASTVVRGRTSGGANRPGARVGSCRRTSSSSRQPGRVEDAARAKAAGDEVRTIIAGYHWFTDWGRDTMISLPGLTLTTGRTLEAGYILRTFAYYIRDGLIPNMFPEGERQGLYHTADATTLVFPGS